MVRISTALNRKGESTVPEGEKEPSQVRRGRQQAGSRNKGGPSTPAQEMTVEYADESKTMEAALKALRGRAYTIGKQLTILEEAQGKMASAVDQQAEQVQEFVTSVSGRLETVFGAVGEMLTQAAGGVSFEDGIPERFAEDKEHQEAWRTARILAAELDAYYPEEVTAGVLDGNLYELLGDRLRKARVTYQQGVSEKVVQECDYFAAAIKALVARKQQSLQEQDSL